MPPLHHAALEALSATTLPLLLTSRSMGVDHARHGDYRRGVDSLGVADVEVRPDLDDDTALDEDVGPFEVAALARAGNSLNRAVSPEICVT
ncbi:hypothetical protein [Saccharopolyspora hattusasensis]|uniref:hypothetical protein n=1 Tax=Saccharopolyspora hattusasensis TaxID=1128679 RepID=UPI003D98B180